jgi:two-component system LytT family response regulator
MTKLRTIIVDDEPLARKLLKEIISHNDNIELIAECKNGRDAVQAAQSMAPDLMFLDIEMPGSNGFDVVKDLQSDHMPLIVFCTAYHRYAVDAFDLHAVDYVLKPVDESRLERSIQRAVDRFELASKDDNHKSALLGSIDEIAKKVGSGFSSVDSSPEPSGTTRFDQKIAIKDHDDTILIDTNKIDWVDAAGDYMCVHVSGVTYVMRSTLKALMSRLDPDKFKRIHRSTVVNLERIVQATSQDKGEYLLHLDCNEQLKVSRNYRDSIKVFLAQLTK